MALHTDGAKVLVEVATVRVLQAADAVGEAMRACDPEECGNQMPVGIAFQSRIVCASCFVLLGIWLFYNNTNIEWIRMQPPETRFAFCSNLNVILCVLSATFNVLQLSSIDDVTIDRGGGDIVNVDFCKYIEWCMTCPMMQLQLLIFAGPAVLVSSHVPCTWTILTLANGTVASLIGRDKQLWKLVFFMFGVGCFLQLIRTLDNVIKQASLGTDSITHGQTVLRKLILTVVTSWIPFPILWLLSPEGLDVARGFSLLEDGVIIAIANMISKVLFIVMFQIVKGWSLKEQRLKGRRSFDMSNGNAGNTPERQTSGGWARQMSGGLFRQTSGGGSANSFRADNQREPVSPGPVKVDGEAVKYKLWATNEEQEQSTDTSEGAEVSEELQILLRDACRELSIPAQKLEAVMQGFRKNWITTPEVLRKMLCLEDGGLESGLDFMPLALRAELRAREAGRQLMNGAPDGTTWKKQTGRSARDSPTSSPAESAQESRKAEAAQEKMIQMLQKQLEAQQKQMEMLSQKQMAANLAPVVPQEEGRMFAPPPGPRGPKRVPGGGGDVANMLIGKMCCAQGDFGAVSMDDGYGMDGVGVRQVGFTTPLGPAPAGRQFVQQQEYALGDTQHSLDPDRFRPARRSLTSPPGALAGLQNSQRMQEMLKEAEAIP